MRTMQMGAGSCVNRHTNSQSAATCPLQKLKHHSNTFSTSISLLKLQPKGKNQPKWHTIYCTPNMRRMGYNIEIAWGSLSKLFLKQSKYEGSTDKGWNRYWAKAHNIKTLVLAWSCVIGAQCILKSCCQQQQSGCESDRPVDIPVKLKQNFNFNRNTHKLYMALRLVMSQYGRVCDEIPPGNIVGPTWKKEKQYKIKETLEPFDVQADVRALVRIATQLLSDFDENNPQINQKIPFFPIDQIFGRAWLPSSQNDARFQLIMACAIAKFMNTSLDLCIHPLKLVQAFRSKTKPNWWTCLKAQLPEQNREKLDFLFTDWSEQELVHSLGNASDVLALLQLEWDEPSVEHLAFDLDLDRELESIEKKLKLLNRFLLIGKETHFHQYRIDLHYKNAGSWAQISRAFELNKREFYHKLPNREAVVLAHNFHPFTISEYNLDMSFAEAERYIYSNFDVLNENEKTVKNYLGINPEALSTKCNTAFSKPVYFTPCIPTLYRNLEEAWKVAYPKHLAKSRIPLDRLERALRRHVMAVGLLVCAYSICQSCLEDKLALKRSVQSFVIDYEFFFYRYPLDDARLRLFSSVFEIAAQYGRVWCDQTEQQDLLPVSMEFVVHALVRIASELTAQVSPYQIEVIHIGNPCIVQSKFKISDEQIPKVIARSWLPTILSGEQATDCRFLFLLARQIGQFLEPECANCISPMKFVKFIHDYRYQRWYDSLKKQQDQRPKWWPIFLDKLPASCRGRLEFIFYSFNHQIFLDNLGDETGKELLALLGLEWDSPQVDHMMDIMSHFQYDDYTRNHVHECFDEIDQLMKQCVHFENREEEETIHFTHLKTIEQGHRGSWAQLSDPAMMEGLEQKNRQFHRVIDNAKHRTLASKYPPVVLYEYVNDRAFIGPVYIDCYYY